MKKQYFLFLFLLSTFAISQVKIDRISIDNDSVNQLSEESLYTAKDIARIDSLILENQLQSVFMDEIKEYYISNTCLLYTSPSPRDRQKSRMPSSA